jgi:hypothetical protein
MLEVSRERPLICRKKGANFQEWSVFEDSETETQICWMIKKELTMKFKPSFLPQQVPLSVQERQQMSKQLQHFH